MSERSIFLTALDLDDPAARADYLGRACGGDADLRGRVEALLAAHADSESFMGRPAAELAPPGDSTQPHQPAAPAGDLAGTVLAGRYELIRELGSGGMGTVYLAEQLRPVRRKVAVKLIRAGMDTRAVLARFDAERQALAVMDHPHIAKVLDAGETDRGRPFFVMEVVDGLPLTDYCDAHLLPVAGRLALFRAVCQAVQHAHQKGVIHRDLKPSNVLVEARDGAAVPKVIDFGLAKAFGDAASAERSLLTAPGAVAGTPLYMAPEQAGPDGHDIDTRADVYALGAILYELLTGTTPLSREAMRRAALDEVLRAVREQEPPTPSSRLASADSTPSAAANRSTEPGRLGRLVRGDLDWVVMKALEKDRNRRYDSAAAFAADVDRFLNHEPVAAGPPSARYRAGKFVRRNRAAVAVTGLVLLSLVAGVVGTTGGLVKARWERDRAESATVKAVEAQDRTFRALDALVGDSMEDLTGRKAAWGDRERAYLEKVRGQFEELATAEEDSPKSRDLRARSRVRLGSVHAFLGQATAAEADYRAAAAEFDRLADEFPDELGLRGNAGMARRLLGGLLSNTGRLAEAAAVYREATNALDRAAAQASGDPAFRFEAALIRNDAGFALFRAGDFKAAEAEDRAAAAALGELAAAFPANHRYASEQARALHNLYSVLIRTGRDEEAERVNDAAVGLLRATVAAAPREPHYRLDLSRALQNREALLSRRGDAAAAEPVLREEVRLFAALAAEYPAVPEYRYELAGGQINVAAFYHSTGRPAEAAAGMRDAAATAQRLADEFPAVADYRRMLGLTRMNPGNMLLMSGRGPEGESAFAAALPVWEKLHADAPASPTYFAGLVKTLAHLGQAGVDRKDFAAALVHLRRADRMRAVAPGMLARDPTGHGVELCLVVHLAKALVSVGDHAAAAPRCDELAAIADPDLNGPGNAYNAGCYLARCAAVAAKDPALADAYAARAVGHLRTAATRGFNDRKTYNADADLTPLRGRADYQSLIAGLK